MWALDVIKIGSHGGQERWASLSASEISACEILIDQDGTLWHAGCMEMWWHLQLWVDGIGLGGGQTGKNIGAIWEELVGLEIFPQRG